MKPRPIAGRPTPGFAVTLAMQASESRESQTVPAANHNSAKAVPARKGKPTLMRNMRADAIAEIQRDRVHDVNKFSGIPKEHQRFVFGDGGVVIAVKDARQHVLDYRPATPSTNGRAFNANVHDARLTAPPQAPRREPTQTTIAGAKLGFRSHVPSSHVKATGECDCKRCRTLPEGTVRAQDYRIRYGTNTAPRG